MNTNQENYKRNSINLKKAPCNHPNKDNPALTLLLNALIIKSKLDDERSDKPKKSNDCKILSAASVTPTMAIRLINNVINIINFLVIIYRLSFLR